MSSEKPVRRNKKYAQSEKGKLTVKKYQQSEKGKFAVKKANKKQRQKEKSLLHDLKVNGCAICGYNKCDAVLHFHHVNPKDKNFFICIGYISKQNLIEEVNKCILLCCNCHQEIHQKECEKYGKLRKL